jgi:SAM-dependent methyltransferase
MSGSSFHYAGRDLEAMVEAENYHRWILDLFAPYLGRRVVEVGAGTGSFSALLAERGPRALALVEPSARMYAALTARTWPADVEVRLFNDFFPNVAERVGSGGRPDAILYVNVLEHVADDAGELRLVRDALAPGGRLLIFVPALMALYSRFDASLGHQRRYTRRGLEAVCAAAGLRVVESRYLDLLGVAPWWLKYRLLRSREMSPGSVRLYDRLGVPLTRALEAALRARAPVGKNVLLVAQRAV